MTRKCIRTKRNNFHKQLLLGNTLFSTLFHNISDIAAVNAIFSEFSIIPINQKDETGCTALYRAVWHNHYEIAKLLLTLGVRCNVDTTQSQ